MRRQIILCLMAILACAASAVAEPIPGSNPETDIRKVDFQNFTYNTSLCSQEYGRKGIGKIVRVRSGEFKNKRVYFTIANDRIIYADVTGDGSEDAIVPVECGATGANFSRSEVYIYTLRNGRATLLAGITDKNLERNYRGAYADAESYWGIAENGIKVNNTNLAIEVMVDGPHASPKYIATLEYGLKGKALSLIGKPQRRASPTQ
jgi:hypothetical protein